jgi:hypothetical protein
VALAFSPIPIFATLAFTFSSVVLSELPCWAAAGIDMPVIKSTVSKQIKQVLIIFVSISFSQRNVDQGATTMPLLRMKYQA